MSYLYAMMHIRKACVEQKSLEITVDRNGGGAERIPCIRRLNLKEGLQGQRVSKATADERGFHEVCSKASTHRAG